MSPLSNEDVLKIFHSTGALLDGHFILTSGLHSPNYFQCAKVLQYPIHTEKLCGELAEKLKKYPADVVVAPALGGIVVGQEVGRQLKLRTLFTERKDNEMQLRRGFEIKKGERVIVCEDVVTTGGSVKEVIEIVKSLGGDIVAVASIVDRSGGRADFGTPFVPLMQMNVVTYDPASCPLCASGSQPVKPGSRT